MSQLNHLDQPQGASFRDPSGFLFQRDGNLYRQINLEYQGHYEKLMASGLYQELVDAGLLIPHEEVTINPADPEKAYKIIQPECIPFVSYPYEWSFSQLKHAAGTTLEIQKRAINSGMSLKDSSAYNIQFHQGHPILVDTLSFEIYREGQPWTPYRQFCQHFLAPVSLMAYRDVRLSQLLRVYIDGIPLDMASKLLPFRTRLIFPLLLHIHLHAVSQRRFAGKAVETSRQMSKVSLLGLIDSLESGIQRAHWSPKETAWGDYYEKHNYTPPGLEDKRSVITSYLEVINPNEIWDLGANIGIFSRIASERGIPTIAFDIDPGAVEQNYLECLSKNETNLLPLLLDLTNPSPSIGWQNQERMSIMERGPADALMALALIHHLAISNNVPFERLGKFFAHMCRWLIIEFVPKDDSQVQRMLHTREDIFTDYDREYFESAFGVYFAIRQVNKIQDSKRSLYLMEKRKGENIP
jgi:hypothetical protein